GPGEGVVVSGDARFEVVTPTLVRVQHAAGGRFDDRPTTTTVPRDVAPPAYTVDHTDGWLVLRTDRLTLRYREGSGAFTPDDLAVDLDVAGTPTTARPTWRRPPGTCAYGTRCEAEDGRLSGGQSVHHEHGGASGRGYASDLGQHGSTDAWTITGVPRSGRHELQVAYANGSSRTRSLELLVGGRRVGRVQAPPTGGWSTWRTTTVDLDLRGGDQVVATRCTGAVTCGVDLDSVAVTQRDASHPTEVTTQAPAADEPGQLGGWTRGLDVYPDQAGPAVDAVALHPGVLNRQGWWLLDDSWAAVRTPDGWIMGRPTSDPTYQDGWFFGYGHDYATALADLRVLTGPAALLPQWMTGVWYSVYDAIPVRTYEKDLLPAFAAHDVPVDGLSVDTDWKSPVRWDGWEWNRSLFPDPQAFFAWAKEQQLAVVLNVHAGLSGEDQAYGQVRRASDKPLVEAGQCFSPDCHALDFGDRAQTRAWFALHTPYEREGVRQWWLDWCCTSSVVDVPGATPDSWLNEQYAARSTKAGERGVVLSRLGASLQDFRGSYPSGPWGEHRSTVHFTGDTAPTWETLALAARLTQDEAAIGQPWVSDDIGSFLGRHLPDDLYARWVQLGTFQPVLRLHSHHGDRLPWQYDEAAGPAADFLRLREALTPYTYSAAWEATQTGQPLCRPLYLDDPESPEAYEHPDEYRFGHDLLVAPVVTAGTTASRTVWFPPGRWVGWFDGRTYTGPSTATVTVPLSQMPVFVRAGGIVTQVPGAQRVQPSPAAVSLTVASSAPGSVTSTVLHTDAGDGLGYTKGESADSTLTYTSRRGPWWWPRTSSRLAIAAASGTFPGAVAGRSYAVEVRALSRPGRVRVDGSDLTEVAPGGDGPGWWYDDAARTLHVRTAALATAQAHTVEQRGGGVRD
ncbi:MAG: TIM-barrel domain-containing protein, partial [Janthinobacterium lividum]